MSMRIAIDATAIPGGSKKGGVANYILNLINALASLDQDSIYYVFLKKEDLVHCLPKPDNFKFIRTDLESRLLRLIWEQKILPKYLMKYKIDILHSPHYTMPYNVNYCRKVVTFHDMTFFLIPEMHIFYKKHLFRKIISKSAQASDAIVCVSNNTATDVGNILDVAPDKVFVTHLGIDSKFKPVNEPSKIGQVKKKYRTSDRFIFYLGTLEPRKNIDKLIKSYNKVCQSNHLEAKLVIGGEKGWDYSKLFKLVSDLNLHNQVIFTGFIDDKELPALYSAAELFVYPSIYEGFGFPVLEAMACGTSVITSNVSSMPEISGSAAVLVNPNDVDELGEAIKRVLIDEKLRSRLESLGIEQSQKYSWENTAKETLKVYQHAFCLN